jgi:hypothetical protein
MAGGVSSIPWQWVWLVVAAFLTGMLNVVAGVGRVCCCQVH